MVYHDPYTPKRGEYECRSCGSRTTSQSHVSSCPSCHGEVRNVAVARE